MREVVLSGIRATGKQHLGNFLGAVQNFVEFQQHDNLCMYFIADYHTLTTLKDPAELRDNLVGMVKDYIAAGLDPERSIIYVQSSVPEIAELCLYLSMVQPLGDLQRIPTYKELVRTHPDDVSLGLITYPVLMAADILGPQSTLVPVGEDQEPNVELARDLAKRFNHQYGQTFTVPEMMPRMVRVPGLDGGKMGKSDSNNAIDIHDPIDTIRARYRKRGVTDPERVRADMPGDPYTRCKSIYAVHELVTIGETETRTIANACLGGTLSCNDCKNLLVDGIAKLLGPFQEKRRALDEQDAYVREVLHEGGKRARAIVARTVDVVAEKMGIVRY